MGKRKDILCESNFISPNILFFNKIFKIFLLEGALTAVNSCQLAVSYSAVDDTNSCQTNFTNALPINLSSWNIFLLNAYSYWGWSVASGVWTSMFDFCFVFKLKKIQRVLSVWAKLNKSQEKKHCLWSQIKSETAIVPHLFKSVKPGRIFRTGEL